MAKVIGYAAIKVIPDTDGFRDRTLRDLQRKLRGAREKVEIPVEFDVDEKDLKKKLDAAEKSADGIEVEVELGLNAEDWAKEKAKARADARKLENDLTRISAKGEQDRLRVQEAAREKRRTDAEADARKERAREKDRHERFVKFMADQQHRWEQFRERQKDNDRKWAENLRKEADRTAERMEVNTDRVAKAGTDAAEKAQANAGKTAKLIDQVNDLLGEAERHYDKMAEGAEKSARANERLFDEFGKGRKHVEWFMEQDFEKTRTVDFLRMDFAQLREDMGRARDWVRRSVDRFRGDFDVEIGVEQDMSAFERLRHRLQEIKDDFDDTKLEFGPYVSKGAYLIARAELMRLARDRLVVIVPVVSKVAAAKAKKALEAIYSASGIRNTVKGLEQIWDYLKRLDKTAPITAAIAGAIAAIGGGALAAVGSISHLVVELARMSGAALALPGILGGFAFGIGVAVAALRDFNREVPKIRKDLTMLQDSLSARFWKEARVPILDAWNRILPNLKRGLDNTATSLGKWTAAMSKAFSERFDMEAFDHMFDNLALSIDISSRSAQHLAQIFRVLGMTGSEYLPKLARWGNDVARSFANWLTEAQKTGKLNQIIDTGVQKLKEFGKLVREAGEFIYILGKAAEDAGFSGLGEMADGLERINERLKESKRELDQWMSGAAKIASGFKGLLDETFVGLGNFAGTFDDLSDSVEASLRSIGGIVNGILSSPGFQRGTKDLFGGLANALASIERVAPQVGNVLGALGTIAGTVVDNIGRLAGAFLEAFGDRIANNILRLKRPLTDLSNVIHMVIGALDRSGVGNWLIDFLGGLAEFAIDGLADTIGNLAISIESLGVVSAAASRDVDSFSESIDGMVAAHKEMTRQASEMSWIEAILNGKLIPKLVPIVFPNYEEDMDRGASRIKRGFENLVNTFNKGVARLHSAFGFMKSALSGRMSLSDILSRVLPTEIPVVGKFVNGLAAAEAKIRQAGTSFRRTLEQVWAWFSGKSAVSHGHTKIKFSVDAVDNATAKFKRVSSEGRKINGSKFTAKADAVDNASSKFTTVNSLGNAFNGKLFEGKLGARDNASPIGRMVMAQFDSFDGKSFSGIMEAKDRASSVVQFVKSKAGEFGGKVFSGLLDAQDSASPKVMSVKTAAESFDGRRYASFLDATDDASAKVDTATGKGQAFDFAVFQTLLSAIDEATPMTERVLAAAGRIDGTSFKGLLGMSDQASPVVNNVQSRASAYASGAYAAVMRAVDGATGVINVVVSRARAFASGVYRAVMTAVDRASQVATKAGAVLRSWARGVYRATLTAVSKVSGVVSNAAQMLTSWARRKYQAVLTARNNVASGVRSATQTITSWARRRYQAVLTARNNTGGAVNAARSRLNGVARGRYMATIRARLDGGSLSGVVGSIRRRISNFVATIRTRMAMANGGVIPSVRNFADGGVNLMKRTVTDTRVRHLYENHVAQIAPAGTYRVWAEAETGGEAYIPLSPRKRERSTAILADVADRFGYRLERYADGSSATRRTIGDANYTVNIQSVPTDVAAETSDAVLFALNHMRRGGNVRAA